MLLAPAVRKMAHLPPERSAVMPAVLGEDVKGASGRPIFLPVRLDGNKAFNVFKDSGAITSMARAQGYIAVEPDSELAADSPVRVVLF
jgi:molybdopterin molybdotransferase